MQPTFRACVQLSVARAVASTDIAEWCGFQIAKDQNGPAKTERQRQHACRHGQGKSILCRRRKYPSL